MRRVAEVAGRADGMPSFLDKRVGWRLRARWGSSARHEMAGMEASAPMAGQGFQKKRGRRGRPKGREGLRRAAGGVLVA